ncbi:MAG: fumarylacetoacetase [Caulobacteraceae bacterium]|nr:fumarylacetoacetase [Caulobacteraceae bacterium]
MTGLDDTHDPALTSWVASARGSAFPIQNLPYCRWRPTGSDGAWRTGVGIGDRILDLSGLAERAPFDGVAAIALTAAVGPEGLNGLMARSPVEWRALRAALSRLLSSANATGPAMPGDLLFPQGEAAFDVPARVGDFTDFYASLPHAMIGSRLNRPEDGFAAAFKWMPLGYHGRSSSIVVSGTPVRRPRGQWLPPGEERPVFAPTEALDFEAELAFWIGGGNALGEPIPIEQAQDHVFGCSILNDWSARDIQRWEMKPVGPLLGKDFATTVSPWIVTMEAMAPFLAPRPERAPEDPRPLPHLDGPTDRARGAIDIVIESALRTGAMRAAGAAPQRLGRSLYRDHYWTIGQMIAHHTSNGLNLRPGDILSSGTISSAVPQGGGCLIELSERGAKPIPVGDGEARGFLLDGDELTLTAACHREGFVSIGFGAAVGTIIPS